MHLPTAPGSGIRDGENTYTEYHFRNARSHAQVYRDMVKNLKDQGKVKVDTDTYSSKTGDYRHFTIGEIKEIVGVADLFHYLP